MDCKKAMVTIILGMDGNPKAMVTIILGMDGNPNRHVLPAHLKANAARW